MASLKDMFGSEDAETFLDLPRARDLSRTEADIVIVGAGCATPYSSVGAYCEAGPRAIRAASAGMGSSLGHINFDLGGPVFPGPVRVVDAGDLPQDANDAAGNRSRIFGAVNRILDMGACPILLGGDDSVQIPMLEAYGARDTSLTILQIDAHIDWRDAVEDETLGLSSTMRRASEMTHIERIVQCGQRGTGTAGPGELADALEWGAVMVPAGEVYRFGVDRALDAIPAGSDVVICLDFDGFDPSVVPSVLARTAGGLSYWQVLELFAGVAEKGRIAGVGMVEMMPERDVDGMGAQVAAQLLTSVLGLLARQR